MAAKADVVSGIAWTALSTFGRRLLALAANIVLARLLTPADFGLVAMAAVVVGFIDVFKDLGTGAALVQREQIGDRLLSTLFWFNAAFGLAAAAAALLCAPLVAILFHEPRVAPVISGLAASFILSALSITHHSMLQRQMRFAALARIELAAAAISYAAGIGAALMGYGVWSLVWQILVNSGVFLLLTWCASRWRPRMIFSWTELKGVMHYSLNLASFNAFFYVAQNADNLLIGRYLGSEALGWYDLAYRLMTFPMQAISAVFGKVMLPYYARAQADLPRFRRAFQHAASAIAFITFPLMLGLMAVREPFVATVFGPRWAPVVTLLAMFAPLAALRSVQTTTGSIFMATGRTDLQLQWGVVASLIVVAGIAAGLPWGITGVAAGLTLASLLLAYPNFAIPLRLIGMRPAALAVALARTGLCSLLMYALVLAADAALAHRLSAPMLLAAETAVGMLSYALLTWMLNRPLLLDFLQRAGLRTSPA